MPYLRRYLRITGNLRGVLKDLNDCQVVKLAFMLCGKEGEKLDGVTLGW